MENQFVPYEIALSLKEIGFEEICLAIYNREETLRFNNLYNPIDRRKTGFPKFNDGKIPAPLWQQAFDWFHKRGFGVFIETWVNGEVKKYRGRNNYPPLFITDIFDTYEEAREACLIKLIEISILKYKLN